MQDHLPTEVAGGERIVRAIKTPMHINVSKKILRAAAFRSAPGTDDVSVMRLDYMGENNCRNKAKEIAGSAYIGLAVISAQAIRDCNSDVFDSREQFWGHAHISHGITQPLQADEPPDANLLEALTEKLKALVRRAAFYHDVKPESETWEGESLQLKPE